jgi:hypothetical protein
MSTNSMMMQLKLGPFRLTVTSGLMFINISQQRSVTDVSVYRWQKFLCHRCYQLAQNTVFYKYDIVKLAQLDSGCSDATVQYTANRVNILTWNTQANET